MRLHGRAARLTVFIGEDDQLHHRLLYSEIVRRARKAGLAWLARPSVFRGIEGFGASSQIHTCRVLSLSQELPLAVVIVDEEQRITDFVAQLDELIDEGLVIIDQLEVYRYTGRGGE
jgi:PII-like signaling protein